MEWLLEARTRERLEEADKQRAAFSVQALEYENQVSAQIEASAADDFTRIMKVSDKVAQINVSGVLTKRPDFFSYFFGGGNTTYSELISSLAKAEANKNIKSVDMYIDSPGGTIDGLFDTLATMQNMKKPIRVIVDNMAASAAYALASQAGEIIAANKAARFGSIGVVASYYKSANVYDITSSNAPNKRPDPSTKEGQKVIQTELDALHELFVDAIAQGRGKTEKQINSDFGQGGMLVAAEALKRGMIDSVEGESSANESTPAKKTAAKIGDNVRMIKMDLNTLKAQHSNVYEEAVADGIKKERDRVAAHLIAGELSGDMETALKASKEGTEMTSALQTQYMMKAANRRDQDIRQLDDAEAESALHTQDRKNKDEAKDDEASKVLAMVQNKMNGFAD